MLISIGFPSLESDLNQEKMAVIYDLLRKKQLKMQRSSIGGESEYFTCKDHMSVNESSSYANNDDIELFRVKPVEIRDFDDSSSIYDSEDDDEEEYYMTSNQNEGSKNDYADQEYENSSSMSSEDELNLEVNGTGKIKNKFKENKKRSKNKNKKSGRKKIINEKEITMQSLSKEHLFVDKAKGKRK